MLKKKNKNKKQCCSKARGDDGNVDEKTSESQETKKRVAESWKGKLRRKWAGRVPSPWKFKVNFPFSTDLVVHHDPLPGLPDGILSIDPRFGLYHRPLSSLPSPPPGFKVMPWCNKRARKAFAWFATKLHPLSTFRSLERAWSNGHVGKSNGARYIRIRKESVLYPL